MPPKVIDWDGRNLPEQLRDLPPGQYVLEPLEATQPLSAEEEDGLLAALKELDTGRGIPLAEVGRNLGEHAKRR